MAVDLPVSEERRNGLTTALNVIVAPGEAFETLRVIPMWGWAFIIACVLAFAGAFLAAPAAMHAQQAYAAHMYATDPKFAQMSDAQKAQYAAIGTTVAKVAMFLWPVWILVGSVISALIFLIVNAVGRGKGTFKQYFAASVNIAIVTVGIYSVVNGLLLMLRGADNFNKPLDQLLAMPSLAWIAPSAAPKLQAFLSSFQPFSIWGAVLTVIALTTIGRIGKAPAWAAAIVMLLIGASFATFAAQ